MAQGVALHADTVLWRKLDRPGHEAARLVHHAPFWQLGGTAVFAHERGPCRLEYQVVCDAGWRTLHAKINGWIGPRQVKADLYTDTARRWIHNGQQVPSVAGCVDLDLAFSPSTNTIPIRRLALNPGERAEVRAAWLSFPDLTLAPLVQTYVRTGDSTYRYESSGGEFVTDLEVGAAGFVLRYPPLWESETGW
ncbi:MAG: putative glycolipid-binding domain-containing protein [Gemmatimonadales bacterium]|nr:putative glycolipid-binding domain-containing protein [Gemmatimonadales bacterium]